MFDMSTSIDIFLYSCDMSTPFRSFSLLLSHMSSAVCRECKTLKIKVGIFTFRLNLGFKNHIFRPGLKTIDEVENFIEIKPTSLYLSLSRVVVNLETNSKTSLS